jgi:hypothetical protein
MKPVIFICRSSYLYLVIILIFCSLSLPAVGSTDAGPQAQSVPEKMREGYESIRPEDSESYLEFLAADELEGRDTPSKGLTIAKRYIQSLYKTWGVQPAGDPAGSTRSYEQKIPIVIKEYGKDTFMEVRSGGLARKFFIDTDFSCSNGADFSGTIMGPVVFAGYGLSAPDVGYDDFANIDVKGKIVVVAAGKPGGPDADTIFNRPENRARFAGRRTPAENCARLLARKGALALIIIDESRGRAVSPHGYIRGDRIRSAGKSVFSPALSLVDPMVPSFWASPEVAEAIFSSSGRSFVESKNSIDSRIRPNSLNFPGVTMAIDLDVRQTPSLTANLLGMIEGSDPELKNEFVVVGAHLDHVGMNPQGYVFNGSDDNGSGSAGVLQIAKALARNPVKPKRSILFAHWTGEEKGLVGSGYFVRFPTVPLENVVANVNLDMISRDTPLRVVKETARDFDIEPAILDGLEDLPEKTLMVFTSAPAQSLEDMSVQLGRDHSGLQVVPLPSFPMLGNSDHYFFCLKKIPAVFFYTGGHRELHQPGDTVDKMNKTKMSRIVRLAYLLAFTIGEAADRPAWRDSPTQILPFQW